MTRSPSSPILKMLQRRFSDSRADGVSDQQLLERFLAQQPAAFEAIVQRHGAMVLDVCRSVSANEADAEDAFQAAFLVLAKKAGSIRKTGSLASWLHGVAYRTALQARAKAARRRTLDAAACRRLPLPAGDPSWSEVRRLVHEELQHLSERYRVPLIACYLQGKTHDQAAAITGLSKATLKRRLERGRELLRARLVRRGLGPTALVILSAWPACTTTGQPSMALVGTVIVACSATASGAALTGVVSAEVAHLANGVARSMIAAKIKPAVAALALAAFVSFSCVMIAAGRSADDPSQAGAVADTNAESQAVEAKDEKTKWVEVVVAGIVVDESKMAAPGAEVQVRVPGPCATSQLRSVTQSDGKFRLVLSQRPRFGFHIAASTADGARLGHLHLDPSEAAKLDWQALQIVVKPARRIGVVVTDAKGQPLAGARAGVLSRYELVGRALTDAQGRATLRIAPDNAIEHVFAWKPGVGFDYRSFQTPYDRSDTSLKAPVVPDTAIPLQLAGARSLRVTVRDADQQPIAKLPMYVWYLTKPGETTHINLSSAADEFQATTDERGEAVWDWLPTWETGTITVWPRTEDFARRRLMVDFKKDDKATLALERMEWLRGRVTHADGTPAAGIAIKVNGEGYEFDGFHDGTTTNVEGRYELRVAPNLMYLVVVSDNNFAAEAQTGFAVMPKAAVPEKNFVLRPATMIHGRVTLGKDRKPLAGQTMYLRQYGSDNIALPNLLPNPGKSRRGVRPQIVHHATTDGDGRFQFKAGPGRYYLSGSDQIKPVQITVAEEPQLEFNFNAEREEIARLSGLVVTGTPALPVANAKISGVYRAFATGLDFAATTDAQGRFDAKRRNHRIVLHAANADGSLGGIMDVRPDLPTVTIPLTKVASARGRLIDGATGEPLAEREIGFGVRVPSSDEPNSAWRTAFGGRVTTDRAGRFALKGLVGGQTYHVDVTIEKDQSWRTVQTLSPMEGAAIDMGDIKLAPERRQLTVTEMRRAAFDAKGTPVERFDNARRDARLSHQHVLVVFGDPEDRLCKQLYDASRDEEQLGSTLEDYRTLWIAADGDRLAAAQALAKKLGVDLANAGPVLAVANIDGELIGMKHAADLKKDGKFRSDEARAFLESIAPKRFDAEVLLADALARAKRENKRVLLQETATWCGPCWRLSRFLDTHRELWEKDYVWLKLDHRWKGAGDIAKRLRQGAEGGIPWTAILDAGGKVLITSNDKDGQNVGFPTNAAAIAHFAAMLRTTAQRLTPADMKRLTDALKAANNP